MANTSSANKSQRAVAEEPPAAISSTPSSSSGAFGSPAPIESESSVALAPALAGTNTNSRQVSSLNGKPVFESNLAPITPVLKKATTHDENGNLRLAGLPVDVLAEVLCYRGNSQCVISLWKCGSSLLNYKLTCGIREMYLKDEIRFSTSRWPKMLSSLTSLRDLFIEHSKGPLMASPKDLSLELQRLSPSLERLRIRSFESLLALFRLEQRPSPLDAGKHAALPRLWDVRAVFPRLTSLEIFERTQGLGREFRLSDCAVLPDSLTHLRITLPREVLDEDASLSQLPRSLKSGDFTLPSPVPGFERTFWAGAPPHLETISIIHINDGDACNDLSYLPSSLTKARLHTKSGPLILGPPAAKTLPPRFKSLLLNDTDPSLLDKEPPWTSYLGLHLESLELCSATPLSHDDVLHLPRSLTSLSGSVGVRISSFNGDTASSWPTGLVHLDLPRLALVPLLPWLPSSITKLETMWSRTHPFSDKTTTSIAGPLLPRSLQSLSLLSFLDESLTLEGAMPPCMTKLEFLGSLAFDFLPGQLPSSLTSLSLATASPRALVSCFAGLSLLKELELCKWSWEVWDYLPPSLTSFKLHNPNMQAIISSETGKRLPQTLTHFEVNSVPNSCLLDLIPPPSLKALICDPMLRFEPSFLERLPRDMEILNIQIASENPECLLHLPPKLKSCVLGYPFAGSANWPASCVTSGAIFAQLSSGTIKYPDPRVTQSLNK